MSPLNLQGPTIRCPQDVNSILTKLGDSLPHLRPYFDPQVRLEELKLDSLDLVELYCVVSGEFQVSLSQPDFLGLQTVGDLVTLIAARMPEGAKP